MKRRTFTLAAVAAAMPTAFLAALPAHAQDGKSYKEIKPPVPTDAPAGQIEVIEFFSYGCPHCRDFEPTFDAWKRSVPKDVAVRRLHVGFNQQFEPLQRIYYTLEAIGQTSDALQAKIFAALLDQHKRIDQPDILFPWIAQQGVDRAKFEQAYKSFGVANQIQRAKRTQDAYQVEGTPGMGIGGRFYTDAGLAQGFDPMLKLVNALIEQLRKRS